MVCSGRKTTENRRKPLKTARKTTETALDLRPVSAADTDEACPVAIGHGGCAQQDVLKVAPSGILGTRLC